MSLDDYCPADHTPNAKSVSHMYEDAMRELALPAPALRLKSWSRLDALTGGFRPREFSILCGATGVGKTCLLANLSAGLIAQKAPHFVASVETGPTDFIKRVLSAMHRVDLNHGDAIPVGLLKQVHGEHASKITSDSLHLSLYDNRFSVKTLMADIGWHVKHKGIQLAVVDNLNFFLEVTSAQNAVIEMDRVIHELIIFCKRVDVHVIMVMHPKKTDGGRVESEFDVKGSSTAVQESHNVFLFNRPHPDLIEAGTALKGDRELKIAKMRRRGKYVGHRLIFSCTDGASYREGEIV